LNQRRLARHLRWGAMLIAAVGGLYLWMRYDSYGLPTEGCSPLARFALGDNLLLDRQPPGFHLDDAVLVRGDDGLLYLGKVTATRPENAEPSEVEAIWIQTDVPGCPGRDSDEFGWVELDAVAARIVMVWPW
jgi:hypothetical protein